MKKFFYSVLAIAALTACVKEKETPKLVSGDPVSENGTLITIRANVKEGTKTAYADKKTFSWLAGDMIRVQISNGEETAFANFKTTEGGVSATFSATVNDLYRPSGLAVYPINISPAVSGEDFTVTLRQRAYYNYYGATTDDAPITSATTDSRVGDLSPMKNLPLIGTPETDGSYSFQSATGILHICFYNVPDDANATFLTLDSNEYLWGKFKVENAEIKMSNYISGGSKFSYYVVKAANGKVDVYWPMPVGTLSKGAQFELLDDSSATIYSVKTNKDVVIERNKITELKSVNAMPYKALGKAKYYDGVLFNPAQFVEVDLEEDVENGGYRINSPYAVYIASSGYSPSATVSSPSPYLSFGLLPKGSTYAGLTVTLDDLVYFGTGVQTGIYSGDIPIMASYIKEQHTGIRLLNVTSFSSGQTLERISYSKVLKYQSDGKTPANIQLAPLYYTDTGYYIWLTQNGNVQIVFPGCDPLDLASGVELGEPASTSSVAQPQYNATFTLGADLTGKYIVASDAASAAAGIATNGIVASNGPAVINLPENAATGTYTLLYETYYNGELWKSYTVSIDYVNPDAGGFTLGDVIGTYDVTAISAFIDDTDPDDDGTRQYTLTIERSDDTDRGNVMFDVSFFGIPINNWPIYSTFDTETGVLSINTRYAFYWNSSYDSSDPDDYQYIMNYHLSYDDTSGWGLDSSAVTFEFDAPGSFYSTYDGYLAILFSSGNIYEAFSVVEGLRQGSQPAPKANAARRPSSPSLKMKKHVSLSSAELNCGPVETSHR